MITAEHISDRLVDWLSRRVLITTGTRKEFRELIADEFSQVAPRQQASLSFEDERAFQKHSEAILKLLRQRPATNAELAKITLRYGARIFDLRNLGFHIAAVRIGRTWTYSLHE